MYAGEASRSSRWSGEQDLEGIVAKPINRIYAAESPPVSVKIKKPAYTQARRRHERFEGARQR